MSTKELLYHNGKPIYRHPCKFCDNQITMVYELAADGTYRWTCRNAESQSIHNCLKGGGKRDN